MKSWLAPLLLVVLAAPASAQSSNKKLCEGFENSEALRGEACKAADKAAPAMKGRLAIANSARQQCLELLNFSTSSKRVRLDPKSLDRCLAARDDYMKTRERPRAKAEAMRQACDGAVVGLQPAGKSCDSAFECAPGLACIGKLGGPPGVCAKPLAKGAACNSEGLNASALHHLISVARPPCGPRLRCAETERGLACVTALKDGETCSGPSDLSACAVGSKCVTGKCVAETRFAPGQSCNGNGDCLVGDRCDRGACVAGKKAGQACSGPRECLSGDCTSGRCTARCGSG